MRKWKANVVCHVIYGKSVYIGRNSDKTSPRYRKVCPDGNVSYAQHAEQHALDQLPYDVNPRRVTVEVFRYGAKGERRMAKPCKDCMHRLLSMGIRPRRIRFTGEDGQMQSLK